MPSQTQLSRWQELDPLQPSERWLLIRSAALLPLTTLALRWFGFRRCYSTYAHLARLSSRHQANDELVKTPAERVAAIIAMANERYAPHKAMCLSKSLVLWHALRVRGISAELQLGVRTITGTFEAHAWVEYNDTVLDDVANVAEIYEPFDLSGITPPGRLL